MSCVLCVQIQRQPEFPRLKSQPHWVWWSTPQVQLHTDTETTMCFTPTIFWHLMLCFFFLKKTALVCPAVTGTLAHNYYRTVSCHCLYWLSSCYHMLLQVVPHTKVHILSPADGVALGAAASTSQTSVQLIVFVAIMLHKVKSGRAGSKGTAAGCRHVEAALLVSIFDNETLCFVWQTFPKSYLLWSHMHYVGQ